MKNNQLFLAYFDNNLNYRKNFCIESVEFFSINPEIKSIEKNNNQVTKKKKIEKLYNKINNLKNIPNTYYNSIFSF